MSGVTVTSFLVLCTELFAAANKYGYFASVFLSTNNGQTWKSLTNGLQNYNSINALVASGPKIVAGTGYLGVYLSSDSGSHWYRSNNILVNSNVALAASGMNLFAGTDEGIYLSTDTGMYWNQIRSLDGISALAVSGQNFYALTNGTDVFLFQSNGKASNLVNTGLK